MRDFLGQCHEAWRGPKIIPVQYRHGATPFSLLLRREQGLAAMTVRLALAALPLLPLWLWNSGVQLRTVATVAGVEAS